MLRSPPLGRSNFHLSELLQPEGSSTPIAVCSITTKKGGGNEEIMLIILQIQRKMVRLPLKDPEKLSTGVYVVM